MVRKILVWAVLAIAVIVPIAAAAMSPQLAWRDPIYISAGFAGVVALCLLLVQPLMIGGYLPGITGPNRRRIHRTIGALLVLAVVVHVIGLWITSPPDAIDALLFRSPTPFSAWGVIAMWALFAAAMLAALRQWLRLRPRTWRVAHTLLAAVIVIGTAVHAILIEGTMETVTKVTLCVLVLAATVTTIFALKVWAGRMTKDNRTTL